MTPEVLILAALSLRGVGPKTLLKGIAEIMEASTLPEFLDRCRRRGARVPEFPQSEISQALEVGFSKFDELNEMGVEMHIVNCGRFPSRLSRIPDPPVCLFTQGDLTAFVNLSIAVIGTRSPSDYGEKVAHRIGQRLAERGITVVSGLAEGCDTAGHRGCLTVRGRTVAFLAHGHGRIYPAANKSLASEILEKGGCLATEYPPGTPPQRSSFVQRDRLQSGASAGVIVIETDVQGGTMHTVGFAETQGRPLAAITHPKHLLEHPKTRGNQYLINEKHAFALHAADDLENFIGVCNAEGTAAKAKNQMEFI